MIYYIGMKAVKNKQFKCFTFTDRIYLLTDNLTLMMVSEKNEIKKIFEIQFCYFSYSIC